MKKIQEAWRSHLNEAMKSDPAQSRIKVAKKVSSYLFSPLEMVEPRLHMALRSSGNIASKYMFLWWAIFGTKKERATGAKIYRPKLGLEYANQKVEMLMLKLTEDEEQVLASDIDTLIDIVSKKENPKSSIQLPVQLSGHPNIEPSFGTTYFGGSEASDWGMGGSVLTPSGESYLLHVLKLVKKNLSPSSKKTLDRQQVKDLYFLGRSLPTSYEDEENPFETGHFSKKILNYQDFLKSIGRGGD